MMIFLAFCRLLIAAIFLSSALSKLRDPHRFTSYVAAYELLPKIWIRPFATTLPWTELIIGLMLFVGWGTKIAAIASSALLLLFLFAMGVNLARGRADLNCGCSGKGHGQKIGWKTIARNVILILICLPLAMWGGGLLALDNQSPAVRVFLMERVIPGTLLPLLLSGAGLILLYRLLVQTGRLVGLTLPEHRRPTQALRGGR